MAKYEELERKRTESTLTRLSAMASRAREEVEQAEKSAQKAKEQLWALQREIEWLYVCLGEPFVLESKAGGKCEKKSSEK